MIVIMDTNKELKRLIKRWNLTQKQVIDLSQRSRTVVYQWTREPGERHYAPMHPADLRLIKRELELAVPKGKPNLSKSGQWDRKQRLAATA